MRSSRFCGIELCPRWLTGKPRFLVAILAATVGIAAATYLVSDLASRSATAAELAPISIREATADKPLSFRDRLIVGLQARLKSEVEFVDLVVLFVHNGDVPQRLVDETFFWARQRAARVRQGRTRRAIIYFQPAMTARLRRLGVEV